MPDQSGWQSTKSPIELATGSLFLLVTMLTLFQPICGTFNAPPAVLIFVLNFLTEPGRTPRPAVLPSSLLSKSICSPTHTPNKGLVLQQCRTVSSRPLSRKNFMQSGIAPCPGNTTRSAAKMLALSLAMDTETLPLTCSSAFATEPKFPIP